MPPYVNIWDPNTPQADESRALGDDRIREFKQGLQERLASLLTFPDGNPLTLLPKSVDGGALKDGAVGTVQIADGAIIAAKIANNALTLDKFEDGTKQAIATVIVGAVTVGENTNSPGADIVLAPGVPQALVYPLLIFGGILGSGDIRSDAVAIVNADTSLAFGINTNVTQLSQIRFLPFVSATTLTIWVVQTSGSSITLTKGTGLRLAFLNTFIPPSDNIIGI